MYHGMTDQRAATNLRNLNPTHYTFSFATPGGGWVCSNEEVLDWYPSRIIELADIPRKKRWWE